MGEIFDRNVHPLYAVMAFVSAAIVLILLLNYLRNTQKAKPIDVPKLLETLSDL